MIILSFLELVIVVFLELVIVVFRELGIVIFLELVIVVFLELMIVVFLELVIVASRVTHFGTSRNNERDISLARDLVLSQSIDCDHSVASNRIISQTGDYGFLKLVVVVLYDLVSVITLNASILTIQS